MLPKPNASDKWCVTVVDEHNYTEGNGYAGLLNLDLALDSHGEPLVAYRMLSRSTDDIRVARRNGTSWQPEVVEPLWNAHYYGLSAAYDSKDDIHLMYIRGGLRHAVKDSSGWNFTDVVTSFSLYGGLSFALDSSDLPHFTLVKEYHNQPYYGFYDGSSWSFEGIEDSVTTHDLTSLSLDATGRPHVLYGRQAFSDTNEKEVYAVRSSGGWSIEPLEPVWAWGLGSIVVDGSGTPHAAYTNYSDLIKYAHRAPGGWVIESLGEKASGTRVSLALDSRGFPWVAFSDRRNRLLVMYAGTDGWKTEIVDDAGVIGEMGIVRMDGKDRLHVAYVVQLGDLYHRTTQVRHAFRGECGGTTNHAPVATIAPISGGEGQAVVLDASDSYDPDNDTLAYRWDFDNDGVADTSWSSSPAVTNTWPDDYTGSARVEVSDNKTTANATATVTILNLPPTTDLSGIPAIDATATLRIAGEKWHDVSAYMVDGGKETVITKLIRQPGKPQKASFPVAIDPTRGKSIRVVYTPEDDKVNGQPNGATPAWLTFSFEGGGEETFHHTFNVRHEETWNWTVSLNQLLAGREVKFTATATDPGSDDLTFTWDWGDGTPATATTYFNDGVGPDQYPSLGGTYPFIATESQTHTYTMAGTYDLKLTVRDDDGGMVGIVVVLVLP